MDRILVCDGEVLVQSGSPVCTESWRLVPYVVQTSFSDVDPVVLVTMFSMGFFIFLVPVSAFIGGTRVVKSILKG